MSDGEDTSTAARMVYETKINMAKARREYRQMEISGEYSDTVVNRLRSAVLDYYDILRPYRDEKNIEEDWENDGIDRLRNLAGEMTTVEDGGRGLGRASSTEQIPAIKTVDPETLVDISYRLDDMAAKLGFMADVDSKSPQTDLTRDLVKEADERAKELKKGKTGDF